jgi:hypothetical protein
VVGFAWPYLLLLKSVARLSNGCLHHRAHVRRGDVTRSAAKQWMSRFNLKGHSALPD